MFDQTWESRQRGVAANHEAILQRLQREAGQTRLALVRSYQLLGKKALPQAFVEEQPDVVARVTDPITQSLAMSAERLSYHLEFARDRYAIGE
jgi:hypothetical protein